MKDYFTECDKLFSLHDFAGDGRPVAILVRADGRGGFFTAKEIQDGTVKAWAEGREVHVQRMYNQCAPQKPRKRNLVERILGLKPPPPPPYVPYVEFGFKNKLRMED